MKYNNKMMTTGGSDLPTVRIVKLDGTPLSDEEAARLKQQLDKLGNGSGVIVVDGLQFQHTKGENETQTSEK